MDYTLQLVLCFLAVALVAFLVPLILQLKASARSVQLLADSAREDLRQMAHDVHQARLQVERVAVMVEKGLDFPATASAIGSRLIRTLAGSSSLWLTGLVTAIKLGLDFLRRPTEAAPSHGDQK